MILDIDYLIDFLKKYTGSIEKEEIEEQDAGSAPPGGEGSAPAGKSPKKWESGLTRGKANQVGLTKWESGRTLGKTYMNDPKYKWTSGRTMGKTGGSDFA
jgi:hypothetical protein